MSMPFVQPSASSSGSYTLGAPIGLSSTQPIDDRQMSRLPSGSSGGDAPWPPPEYDPVTYLHRIWSAWHVGDRQMLSWVYYNLLLGSNSPYGRAFFATTGEKGMPTPRPGQYRGGLLGSIEYSFWLKGASPFPQVRSVQDCMYLSAGTSPRPPHRCYSQRLLN
jgi:hypothetical protein